MARSRIVKPSFFFDEDLAAVSMPARLLFIGLWTIADREGRLEDRPVRLKAQLFPYDNVSVDALLNELAAEPGRFITRYAVSTQRYIAVRTFLKHQSPHKREPMSEIPPPGGIKPGLSMDGHDLPGLSETRFTGMSRQPGDPVPDPVPDPVRDPVPTPSGPEAPDPGPAGPPTKRETNGPTRGEAIALTNGSQDHPGDSIGLSGELMRPRAQPTNAATPHARTQKLRTETPDRLRPDNPANIVQCLKVAVERAYPARGMWTPHRFAYSDAQRFWDSIKSDPRAVETIERRIGLYIKSEIGHKNGWSLSGFIDGFNQLVANGGVSYAKIG